MACDYFRQICNLIRFLKDSSKRTKLHEEEKNAAPCDKETRMCVRSVSEANNQRDRTDEIAMGGLLHIQNLCII